MGITWEQMAEAERQLSEAEQPWWNCEHEWRDDERSVMLALELKCVKCGAVTHDFERKRICRYCSPRGGQKAGEL